MSKQGWSPWAVVLVAACGGSSFEADSLITDEADATGRRSVLARTLSESMARAELMSEADARNLLEIGRESGWAVFMTPAVAGPQDDFQIVLLAMSALTPASSTARHSGVEGWTAWTEVSGAPFVASGRSGFIFDIAAIGHDADAEVAFRLGHHDGTTEWLNNNGDNFALALRPELEVSWTGDQRAYQGTRRIRTSCVGRRDIEVTAETFPESPEVAATLFWDIDGVMGSTDMGPARVHAGTRRQNTRWSALIPGDALLPGKRLRYWIESDSGQHSISSLQTVYDVR